MLTKRQIDSPDGPGGEPRSLVWLAEAALGHDQVWNAGLPKVRTLHLNLTALGKDQVTLVDGFEVQVKKRLRQVDHRIYSEEDWKYRSTKPIQTFTFYRWQGKEGAMAFERLEHIALVSTREKVSTSTSAPYVLATHVDWEDGTDKDAEQTGRDSDLSVQKGYAAAVIHKFAFAAPQEPTLCTGYQTTKGARYFPDCPRRATLKSRAHAHIDVSHVSVPSWCPTVLCHPPAEVCRNAEEKSRWYETRMSQVAALPRPRNPWDWESESDNKETITFVDGDTSSGGAMEGFNMSEIARKVTDNPESTCEVFLRSVNDKDQCVVHGPRAEN